MANSGRCPAGAEHNAFDWREKPAGRSPFALRDGIISSSFPLFWFNSVMCAPSGRRHAQAFTNPFSSGRSSVRYREARVLRNRPRIGVLSHESYSSFVLVLRAPAMDSYARRDEP